MDELGRILIENNLSISSVESFTVGGFASAVGSVPGISKVYRGSIVTYQTEMKKKILGIDENVVASCGVVSSEVAIEMAKKGQLMFESDICISFTGNSGPLPMENKPVGLCYMAITYFNEVNVYELHLSGSREEIKNQAIHQGIQQIKNLIKYAKEEK